MQFEARARLATKMYVLYIAEANRRQVQINKRSAERSNEEVRQMGKS
ncbi:MAG: hypothetical protein AAB447_01050 [Patescibacteria group bacterium]